MTKMINSFISKIKIKLTHFINKLIEILATKLKFILNIKKIKLKVHTTFDEIFFIC